MGQLLADLLAEVRADEVKRLNRFLNPGRVIRAHLVHKNVPVIFYKALHQHEAGVGTPYP